MVIFDTITNHFVGMGTIKTVSFFGHRNFKYSVDIQGRLYDVLDDLIKRGATTFLFGSRSKFDAFCYDSVTAFQHDHPGLERVEILAPHETAFTSKQAAKKYAELIKTELAGWDCTFADYECAAISERSVRSRQNSYIARNQDIIDQSDVCVFYYDPDYLPPRRKKAKHDLSDYQPNSGTALAYKYAKSKNKILINIF